MGLVAAMLMETVLLIIRTSGYSKPLSDKKRKEKPSKSKSQTAATDSLQPSDSLLGNPVSQEPKKDR